MFRIMTIEVNIFLLIIIMSLVVKCESEKPVINLTPGDIIKVSYLKKNSNVVYDNLLENSKTPITSVNISGKPELIIYDVIHFNEIKLLYYQPFYIEGIIPKKRKKIFQQYGEKLSFDDMADDSKKNKKYHRYELITLCYHLQKRELPFNYGDELTKKPLKFIKYNRDSRIDDFNRLFISNSSAVVVRFNDPSIRFLNRATIRRGKRKVNLSPQLHYLTSITTGNCLYQLASYQQINHNRPNNRKVKKMRALRQFKSVTPLKSMNNNSTFENLVKKYINEKNNDYDNETIDLIKVINSKEIWASIQNEFKNDVATKMEFKLLPSSFGRNNQYNNNNNNNKKDELLYDKCNSTENLQPGYTINITHLNSRKIEIINSILADQSHILKKSLNNSKTGVKISKCLEFGELASYEESFEIQELNSSKNLRLLRNFNGINYGIDEKFINDDHMFVLLQVCKFASVSYVNLTSTEIVDLNTLLEVKKYIFINKDVLFYNLKKNETHYISSIFKGDCLYQVLVYLQHICKNVDNQNSIIEQTPVNVGRILSISNNHTLENWVENHIKHENNDETFSILKLKNNQTLYNTIMNQLNDNVTVSLELHVLVPN